MRIGYRVADKLGSQARRVLPHVDNFVYGKRWQASPGREGIAF